MRRVLQLQQFCMFCLQRHSIHCIPSTKARSRRIVPLRSIHLFLTGIIPVLLHLRHYLFHISNAISSTAQSAFTNSSTANKGVFLSGISIESKNSNNSNDNGYDGGSSGATIPDSTRPNRTHPHPVFALSHCLLAYASPSPASSSSPSLIGIGASANTSSKVNRQWYNFEFIVLTIWVGRCRVGEDEDDGDDAGG
jgi:hypothetical protein